MGYWRKKQIKSENTNEILINLQKETNSSSLKYNVIKVFEHIENSILINFKNFINENYVSNSLFKLKYSEKLLLYYLKNCLIIKFYNKDNNKDNNEIGYIVGKNRKIVIFGKEQYILEVNFLCLIPKFRELNFTGYMINIITKECINNYPNIKSAYYTISKDIDYPYFNLKKFNYIPINFPKITHSGLFNHTQLLKWISQFKETKSNINENLNSFRILRESEITTNIIDILYLKLVEYYKDTFDIYNVISKEHFDSLFKLNDIFKHFIIVNESNEITNYICFYKLNYINIQNFKEYNNGYLYLMMLSPINENLEKMFNLIISESKNTFDLITFTDIFNSEQMKYINCISCDNTTKYYLFNQEINNITSDKNALITI